MTEDHEPTPDTIPLDDLLDRLHKVHGHRLAVLRQLFDEDRTEAARVHGEAVAYSLLIRSLEDYRETGDLGTAPDAERYDAYADVSRALLRADDLAAVDDSEEGLSFQ